MFLCSRASDLHLIAPRDGGDPSFRKEPLMSTAVVEARADDAAPAWHQQFLALVVPAVEASARRRFRTLPVAEREESTAEAIAGALVAFVRLINRGKDPAAFAGRLALVAVL